MSASKKRGLQRKPRVRNADPENSTLGHPLVDQIARDQQALVVPLHQLKPSEDQPRQTFDESTIEELAKDIKANGLINPLTVVEEGEGYRVIAGERRYRALKQAGQQDAPVRIVSPSTARAIQLAENLHREDLPLLEEAQAFAALRDELSLTVRDLADKVRKSKSYVQRRLAIMEWPEDVQELLRQEPGMLTAAEAIARINDPKRRAQRIAALLSKKPERSPEPKPERERPEPFRFKERARGGFDVQVRYRPNSGNREELIAQLREVLQRLEAEEKG